MSPAKKAEQAQPDPSAPDAQELADIARLSYEDARDELVDVVRRLESGGETLEDSLALWQRGEALANHCESWLAGARARIEAAQSSRENAQP